MTNSFIKRNELTKIIQDNIKNMFSKDVELIEFGIENIIDEKSQLSNYLKILSNINGNDAAMMLEFAPDYIIFKKNEPKNVYFLEIKFSKTPCWARSRLEKIQSNHNRADYSNIGEIAREAYLAYKRFYPKTIIVMGATYNQKKLMAQFVEDIDCFYCHSSENDKFYCDDCPIKNNTYFENERNRSSSGSQTSNTNINLDSFEEFNEFFSSLGISTEEKVIEDVKSKIEDTKICFPNKVPKKTQNSIRDFLDVKNKVNTSSNIKIKNNIDDSDTIYYSAEDNNFIHSDSECFILKTKENVTGYKYSDVKDKRKCKFCCNKN